jgi:hypothetical protein
LSADDNTKQLVLEFWLSFQRKKTSSHGMIEKFPIKFSLQTEFDNYIKVTQKRLQRINNDGKEMQFLLSIKLAIHKTKSVAFYLNSAVASVYSFLFNNYM